jgi:TatD DNase family protein
MFFPDVHTHFLTENSYAILNANSSINSFHSRGIHPWQVDDNYTSRLNKLESELQHSHCVALGEIGLDKMCSVDFELQRKIFIQQIELSEKYKMPIIIHCVRASNELFQIKKELKPSQKWIWHGFNKVNLLNQTLANEIIPSFGEVVLINKSIQNEVINLDSNLYLLETDTSTFSIEAIYKEVSELRNQSLETIQNEQLTNFTRIFTKWQIG